MRWYVIHVFTGQEEKIKTYLEEEIQRLNLAPKFGQILIPSEEIIEMRDGRK